MQTIISRITTHTKSQHGMAQAIWLFLIASLVIASTTDFIQSFVNSQHNEFREPARQAFELSFTEANKASCIEVTSANGDEDGFITDTAVTGTSGPTVSIQHSEDLPRDHMSNDEDSAVYCPDTYGSGF